MKLLVTGGLGFIGSNFIRRYLARHPRDRIVNLDLCTYAGNPANVADLPGRSRYVEAHADIADPKAVERAMKGADCVVHFAAETHVDRSIHDSGAFLRTNVLGTRVLLEAALRHRVRRFVHISTDEVYGSVVKGFSREQDCLLPNSPYAASKAGSDLLARSYWITHRLPVIITRASNNFGPYQHPEKAIPLMITNWLEGLSYPLYGDGLNVRDWLFVEDNVRAVELVLRKGKPGEIYNIGGEFATTNKNLVERARRLMDIPRSLVRRVPDRLGHDRRYALNCDKLRGLGFKHSVSFEEGLLRTIEWYRSHACWWRAIKGREDFRSYYRKQYQIRGTR